MSSQLIAMPWREPSELLQVRQQLYPRGSSTPGASTSREDSVQQWMGVGTVRQWQDRGNLPRLVESTALLVHAILNEYGQGVSPWCVQAVYAMAFARFVTGLVDTRQKATHKRSMYEIAEEIGLPASFVELRHAVTHDELPSVTVLRHAVNRSLAWLWDHYWQRIDEETGLLKDDETSTSNDVQVSKETFKDIFRPYIKWKIKQAREKKESGEQIGSSKAMNSTTSQEKEMIDRACRRCVRICRGNTKAMAVLASALLDTRLMIPANRTLRSSLTAAFQLWDPILKTLAIHQLPFLKTLVSEVVRRLSLPSEVDVDLDPTYEAIYLWLQHILYDLNWTSCRRSRGRHPVTSKDDLEIREASGEEPGDDAANSRNADFLDWDSIIAACLNGQNKWSLRFLEMVVLDGRKIDSMSKEQRDEMCHDWADLVRRALEERFPAGAMPPAVTDE